MDGLGDLMDDDGVVSEWEKEKLAATAQHDRWTL